MKKKCYVIIAIMFLCANLLASDKLIINYDYASFCSLDNNEFNNYIELYFSYSLAAYTMTYSSDDLYSGNIIFDFRIDSLDTQILNEQWEAPISFYKNQLNDISQDFYGLKRFFYESNETKLYAGEYKATLSVLDKNSNRYFQDTFNLIINSIEKDKIGLSSTQIANIIIPKIKSTGNEAELFYKNQYYVYPNPQAEISSDILTLYTYSEIYNAHQLDGTLEIKYEIRNAKNIIEDEYTYYKTIFSNAMVETLAYPIDILPTGFYTLVLRVIANKDTITNKKNFYVINKNIELDERKYYTEDEQFDLSEFATMSEDKVKIEFSQSEALATKDEIILWKKLTDLKAKQRFLFQFWYIRNSDIGNNFNNKLFEHRERVKYVNTYYSYAGGENGWNTDRGRIYIKFGPPDHKEEVPGNPVQYPYQVWTYHSIEGGTMFVFIDMMGLENYKLMHSTHSGYITNYNWQYIVDKKYIKVE